MSNYIISFDLEDADSAVRNNFMNELTKFGWTLWERRTSDSKICKLPNTTMLIKNMNDIQVIASVRVAAARAELSKNGATLSKCTISEYRRVHFESDEELTGISRSNQILKSIIEDSLLS